MEETVFFSSVYVTENCSSKEKKKSCTGEAK
jgi:hypothetical protein